MERETFKSYQAQKRACYSLLQELLSFSAHQAQVVKLRACYYRDIVSQEGEDGLSRLAKPEDKRNLSKYRQLYCQSAPGKTLYLLNETISS